MDNPLDSGPFGPRIEKEIQENIFVTTSLARSCTPQIAETAALIIDALTTGAKLIAFGNGGSGAQAEHFVAELVGRYRQDRQPLAAVALTTDSVALTAIANDYGFEQVFSRQLQAVAKAGDIAVAISTSGNSQNVLSAARAAGSMGLVTIGLTGSTGGKLASLVRVCLKVPSDCTPRIQEAHALVIHLLCGLVEDALSRTSSGNSAIPFAGGRVP